MHMVCINYIDLINVSIFDAGSEIEALHKVASYPESPWILLDSLKSITYRIYTVGENALGKSLKSNDTTGHPHNPVASARAYHSVPFYEELWFIVLVVVLALLILVCIILCCVLCRGGGKYPGIHHFFPFT